ncbi:interleukin-15 receptor subunit alpha isoform X2 [Tiliqua scincoides]|uniref:interleukin-15 receptor subunit alpha isoform X2 n=1 Tax=Tiliqua scincoides TaxID=71010 RepID=UPI0034619112
MACLPLPLLLLCGWTAASLPSGKCGIPMQIKNAEIEVTGSTRLRYSCVKDYKRKAGTSNLIVCKQDGSTKQYQWTNSNLNCIRDPSKPATDLPGTTEDSRQKTETSTPTRKLAAPQTSVNTAMVSSHPSGSLTTNSVPTSSTTDIILPTAAGPSPDASVMTDNTTEVVRWLSPGTVIESTTLQEQTTMQDSQTRTNSQPSFRSPAAQNRSTAMPSRVTAAARNTAQPPVADDLDRQTGSLSVRIVLPCLGVLIIILCALWRYFCVRLRRFPWHRGVPPEEEIPMQVTRSEERGRTSPAASHSEGAQMLSPHCVPTTG